MNQPVSQQPLRVERGGQDAVVRRGAVRLEAVNCAFGPHAAAFRFEGEPAVVEDGRADVRHCSMLAGSESVVFDFADRAAAELHVEACLFSRPSETASGMGTATRAAGLLRQATATIPSGIVFVGKNNRYHNLDAAWLFADGSPSVDWRDFDRRLADAGGSDRFRLLEENPWKAAQPLKLLEQPPPANPSLAFRPNDQLSELRLPGPGGRDTVAGVERIDGEDFTPAFDSPARQKPQALAENERLVDPEADEDVAKRIYNRLEAAVEAAASGDVILIRHQDRLTVGPLRLFKRGTDLTIRPAAGYRPKLIPSDTSGVAALLTLRDGWLRLEDLDFRLQPGDETRSLSLVALAGGGQCTLKGCVVTLEAAGSTAPLAVASVPEAADGTDGQPQLTLEGCFIRGEGDVVRDRSGRAFDLKARNTLAVLNGSFLSVASGTDAASAGQSVRATLGKVTTYLTEHLVRLQADRDQRGPVPVQCEAKGCLFVAAAGKSLVHLDGPETGEDRLRERLMWSGEGNAYGNLKERMFDQVAPGDEMAMPGTTVSAERWRSLFKEDGDSKFLPSVQFESAPSAEGPFYRVEPPQMRPVSSSLKEIGAGPNVPMPGSSER